MEKYDYIIAGAGAAGLSLLWQFIHNYPYLNDKSILVVDQNISDPPDKTWCFWEDHHFPDPSLIHHTWNNLDVRFKENAYTLTPQNYQYHCVRSLEYHSAVIEQARNITSITFLESEILDIEPDHECSSLITNNGTYEASWIFQSCFVPPLTADNGAQNPLKQHFLGWEIQLEQPLLVPNTATFMDFDVPQQEDGMSFMYLLPFTPSRALIEYTVFGKSLLDKEVYEKEIQNYLSERIAVASKDYQIKRQEFGWVPMSDQRFPGWYGDRILNTGLAGGTAKPSTGYSFIRAHQHAGQIVGDLVDNKTPRPFTTPYRYRIYDLQLLYLLYYEPKLSVEIFHCLFQNNPIDRLLAFLGEETNPLQDLAVMNSVPYIPFLKAMNQIKRRVITGK